MVDLLLVRVAIEYLEGLLRNAKTENALRAIPPQYGLTSNDVVALQIIQQAVADLKSFVETEGK